jgi:hypothetical protein
MLAGAVGAGLVIACVALASPRFAYQVVEIPRIVTRDLSVNNPIPRDKPFDVPVPRLVPASPEAASPLARNPAERRFVETPEWKGAIVRGRILREDGNGFDLATEDGGETSFYPARLNAVGKVEDDEGMKDVVAPYLNDLAACRPMPTGVYICIAEQAGKEGRVRPEGGGETARVDVVDLIGIASRSVLEQGREHSLTPRIETGRALIRSFTPSVSAAMARPCPRRRRSLD